MPGASEVRRRSVAVSSFTGGLRLGRLGRYRGAPSGAAGSRRAAERPGGKPGTWGGVRADRFHRAGLGRESVAGPWKMAAQAGFLGCGTDMRLSWRLSARPSGVR